jgi:Zn-dependent protease with chaperone function
MELSAASSPDLFAMIEALRRQLGAPRFHHVLLTDDFNAAVVQSPRLGIFGWPRNYLLIGLPLMKGLTVEQFKAVLAHEFGHLAKGHGRVANWIYRQRLRWRPPDGDAGGDRERRAIPVQAVPQLVRAVLQRVLVSACARERVRSRRDVGAASPRQALLPRAHQRERRRQLSRERYWPQVHKKADDQPQPGFAPFSSMSHHVATDVDPASAKQWLSRAMQAETTLADTHPALADRLKAIGEAPNLAPPAQGEAG